LLCANQKGLNYAKCVRREMKGGGTHEEQRPVLEAVREVKKRAGKTLRGGGEVISFVTNIRRTGKVGESRTPT